MSACIFFLLSPSAPFISRRSVSQDQCVVERYPFAILFSFLGASRYHTSIHSRWSSYLIPPSANPVPFIGRQREHSIMKHNASVCGVTHRSLFKMLAWLSWWTKHSEWTLPSHARSTHLWVNCMRTLTTLPNVTPQATIQFLKTSILIPFLSTQMDRLNRNFSSQLHTYTLLKRSLEMPPARA